MITPDSLDGTPQTMPTNNWWTGLESAGKAIAQTASGLAGSYSSLMESKARIRAFDVAAANRPPGMGGMNPQAAGIAGGIPDYGTEGHVGIGVALAVIGAIVVLVMMARK